MYSRPAWMVSCLILALLAGTSQASAQRQGPRAAEEQTKKEASTHFKRGAELFEEGLYRPALIELQRAYDLTPNYRVLYNIGQAHIALGEFVEAIRTLDAFLVQGGRDVESERAEEVRDTIAQLRQRTATLSVNADRDDATISLDGVSMGRAPIKRVTISVGRHRITAETETGASAAEEIELAGGDHRDVSLSLVDEAVAEGVPMSPVNSPAQTGLSTRKRWSVGLLATAGAAGLTGLGMALMARSAHDDYDRERSVYPGVRTEIDDARQRMTRTGLAADVMFGAAGALAVTGLVLWLVDGKDAEAQPSLGSLRFGVGPHALVAEGRF
jgi:hypothetical protein